ncbi:L,D-transpeptidase family protein [Sediminicoccus sp. KRV36]|uniref:L,D-transpeptidase family protein n=1 Tax=Sediminicoccus sp. KRV36 TaxID=3133721 RepID=UPI00200BD33F|nr:L,D-transpeptidase family protein [Sediminicoccus rosea]UPY39234.1 L,D-transpeptidase family protein [Sediminicoccus rosea]
MDRRDFLAGLSALAVSTGTARAQGVPANARTMVASPEAMRRLSARLMRLEEDGLDPRWYDLNPGNQEDPATIARASAAALTDLVQGRVASMPGRVDLRRENSAATLNAWFQRIAESAEPAEVIELAAMAPPDMDILKPALAAARVRATGAWPGFPVGGRTLEPGSFDEARVRALRARLVLTDPVLAANPGTGASYDENLQAAVRRFQTAVGTEADGRIGLSTQAALNRSPQANVNQLRVAMDMRRAQPVISGERRVDVNIPDYRLRMIEEGRTIIEMAVVVGRPTRATPMITTRLTSVQFNPSWGVPQRNAKEDLLPRLRRDPTALQQRGFRIFGRVDGQVVEIDPTTVDWRAINPDRFPYVIRQDAGDANALGRIKFIMPNADDIYMHDTPDRHYFRRADRAQSSGCIRLERPMDFLMVMLDGMPGWERDRVDRVLATRNTSAIPLRRQVPVRLFYATVTVEGSELRVRQDIYGLDEAYARAMEGRVRPQGIPMAAAQG